ncbi:hypothetical protein Q8A64_17355 [Oxalobacteraceae bacterium R-40]|uniref:Uncharacterized protein n=1 Tax=Keguizhuia sedimenti TaxID=3064264 RepID=A0ABU1BT29_9BURK|nr:hypothetical protein [Oxalobacteraceae bacterium R-40]
MNRMKRLLTGAPSEKIKQDNSKKGLGSAAFQVAGDMYFLLVKIHYKAVMNLQKDY